ncbi:hypothetical protein MBLNU230_g2578t1 [Neophaeotheca triangularis]
MPQPPVPAPGIWAPAITFIDPSTDTLALAAQTTYFQYLSRHLTGLVILGTNAETFLLTRAERSTLLRTARSAVGPSYPLMAGVSGHSTAQVLEYIADAVEAGMDYLLVLPPAYLGKAATSDAVVEAFYDAVVAASPLPVVLYNFPGVCNGVDMDSDLIERLALKHAGRITGVKLTCASVAKIVRLAAVLPRGVFSVFGGQADFLLGGLVSGSAGCISAMANVIPKVIVRVWELWREGKVEAALELHRKAARAERVCKGGIAGTKFAVALLSARLAGIEGAEELLGPRRPYGPLGEAGREGIRGLLEEVRGLEEDL